MAVRSAGRLACRHCLHEADISVELLGQLSEKLKVPPSHVAATLAGQARGVTCSRCGSRDVECELPGSEPGPSASHRIRTKPSSVDTDLPCNPEPELTREPGVCTTCGERISEARLAIYPKASTCVPCLDAEGASSDRVCRRCGRAIEGKNKLAGRWGCSGCSHYAG